jgi:hypothetical protein
MFRIFIRGSARSRVYVWSSNSSYWFVDCTIHPLKNMKEYCPGSFTGQQDFSIIYVLGVVMLPYLTIMTRHMTDILFLQ